MTDRQTSEEREQKRADAGSEAAGGKPELGELKRQHAAAIADGDEKSAEKIAKAIEKARAADEE